MKKLFLFMLMFLVVIVLSGCEQKVLVITGETEVELGCSILLEHNFEKGNENWYSSDDSIASVIDGMVIANSEGIVTIYLEIGEYKAEKEIEVINFGIDITINGQSTIYIGDEVEYQASLSNGQNGNIVWSSSDESVLKINQKGEAQALKGGVVTIYANLEDTEHKSSIRVVVVDNSPNNIIISGSNKMASGSTMQLEVSIEPSDARSELVFESSDESIASVSETGLVSAKDLGSVIITVYSKINKEKFSTFEIEVTKAAPSGIVVSGEQKVVQGKHYNYKAELSGEDVYKQVKWEVSDPTMAIIYQGILLGVRVGKVTINCISLVDESIKGSFEVEITAYEGNDYTKEELDRVNAILNNMDLSQKIGQMFVVGFSGTSYSSTFGNVIRDYNFGNVIYMGANVTNPNTISAMSNAIQEKMVLENGVASFISIDQEGGSVARIKNGGTHFISNMAMAATGDFNNTYLEGIAMGQELRNYGINLDFAPVLDVNNNPSNPVIGIRSYSDNPLLVSMYGKNMFTGLQESSVMGCSKHFPGHGNTSVDSHYGLPTITTNKEDLYKTELAPFISAISNGIDSIMTTHIIFSAIDSKYPATLSEKVLTNLLREELGYDGLIITDGMEMGAVTNNFGGYDKTAVLAIKAGVDMLLYTSNNNPRTAHSALVQAVNNNEISIERINDSVRRILLKKLKYGLLDNYRALDKDISDLLAENEKLNLNFAMQSLTKVKGDFTSLDKNKSTLIISPSTSNDLGMSLSSNSFANYASVYLKEKGHKKVDYVEIEKNISSSKASSILEMAKQYDQIVVAMSNTKTSSYSNSINFVNNLYKLNNDIVVVALDSPYDIIAYQNVNNYICVYGYQKATVIALTKYLNGEFEAKGVLALSTLK